MSCSYKVKTFRFCEHSGQLNNGDQHHNELTGKITHVYRAIINSAECMR
jgi:hypothetical protein